MYVIFLPHLLLLLILLKKKNKKREIKDEEISFIDKYRFELLPSIQNKEAFTSSLYNLLASLPNRYLYKLEFFLQTKFGTNDFSDVIESEYALSENLYIFDDDYCQIDYTSYSFVCSRLLKKKLAEGINVYIDEIYSTLSKFNISNKTNKGEICTILKIYANDNKSIIKGYNYTANVRRNKMLNSGLNLSGNKRINNSEELSLNIPNHVNQVRKLHISSDSIVGKYNSVQAIVIKDRNPKGKFKQTPSAKGVVTVFITVDGVFQDNLQVFFG